MYTPEMKDEFEKTKVLILSAQLPSNPNGAAVSIKYRFDELSKFYDLYLIARGRKIEIDSFTSYKKYWIIKKTRFSNIFLFVYRYLIKTTYICYREIIQNNVRIVQLEHFENIGYSFILFPLKVTGRIKIFYTAHDLHATYFKRNSFIYVLIKFIETVAIKFFLTKVFVWGQDDKQELLAWGIPVDKITKIPLIVPQSNNHWQKNEHSNDFIFVGAQGHKPNRDALHYILESLWPKIIAKYPDSKLHLVLGRSTDTQIKGDNVINHGYVEDVYQIMSRANILLAPIFSGAGIKIKVADAFAFGIPVILSIFALKNYDNIDPTEILIADNTQDLLELIDKINSGVIDLNRVSDYQRSYCAETLSNKNIDKYISEYEPIYCIKN